MTPAEREQENKKLEKLRGIAERLTGDTWYIEGDDDGIHVLTLRQTGEQVKILTFHHEALPDEQDLIAGALDNMFLFLGFVGRAVQRVKELRDEMDKLLKRRRSENYGFQAQSLCQKIAFWRFLETRGAGGAIASATAADTRLKFLLDIKSKGDLNVSEVARQRFFKLRSDFYAWQRGDPA
jgi:hypothetical protein